MKRWLIALLVCLLLPFGADAKAETEEAADLSKACTFDFGSYPDANYRVLHKNKYHQKFDANASFSLTWEEAFSDARLCLQWYEMPEGVSVLQYDALGTLVRSDTLLPYPETITPLLPESRKAVVQAGEAGMRTQFCAVYGPGELPDPFHEWQETPDHLDYLLISTHPDDDVLFLGSVVPTYGAEQGYIGTIIYVTCDYRARMSEAENGAWAMGLRYRPVFFGLPDVRQDAPKEEKDRFRYEELLEMTVRAYRSLRPAVVFAQDENGEYGHWQHKLTSKAAREAFALAADPAYDPESAEAYGTWQVQKLYLHLYPENTLMIDAHAGLSFFGGLDAYQVARAAYKKHESQQAYSFAVKRDDKDYAFNRFGMAEGVVPAGEDVFDHVEPSLLSDYVPPPPTPEPTPEPTPDPTPEPTEAPPETDARIPEASAAPKPDASAPAPSKFRPLIWIAVGTVAAAAIGGTAAYFWRKRRNAG